MTTPDLTIDMPEELPMRLIEHFANTPLSPGPAGTTLNMLARQLLATMKREAELKHQMRQIAKPALGGKEQQYRAQATLKELYPNEYSEDKK